MTKPCFLIPIYNHGETLVSVVSELAVYGINCLIVDDGSDQKTKAVINHICQQYSWVKSISLALNSGKGAAIMNGFQYLYHHHYTHAIQVDADHQHDLNDLSKFLTLFQYHPNSLISGKSIYDKSVPKARLHGRKITNFWVAIETWSTRLVESMCGFRIYPLNPLQSVLPKVSGRRMEFDIEIMVKAYWQAIDVKYIPTQINYPKSGQSHFRLWKDNVRISWLHTRLFFAMFYYMPRLHLKKLINRHDK
ncbi:glycosyltransferase family 2 protein [Fastidiosibacter lacustris]|uniref:glycosyltransferase family 2 protein n=1 Tax=Fastidiosibacter lacustris TaxID=2056695 RepID=UPI000E352D87|nr:glycosyltransferase family 2 protein [Fastidiosibacter lacustris]